MIKFDQLFLLIFVGSNFFGFSTGENNNVELEDLFVDLKAVAMNYAEPFLTEVKIKESKMEGFNPVQVIPIVSKAMLKTAEMMKDEEFKNFAAELGQSIKIQNEAFILRSFSYSDHKFDEQASKIEKQIFSNKRVVFPVMWNGPEAHAMLIIIEPSKKPFEYNMIFANTGMGVNYHQGRSDENGIIPLVFRTWKRFENIPLSQFVKGNHWFIQALGLLMDFEYMTKSRVKGTSDKYMYGTILANLKSYEITVISSKDDRFIRAQGSGSCAYSSLMAGLLYVSRDKSEYLRRRFIYGQTLMKTFLEKHEENPLLIQLLTEAYEPMARYLMKQLSAGIALQTLEFLESQDPIAFKSAALIGAKRSNELKERSSDSIQAAIKSLKSLKDLEHVKEAINLALRVRKLLDDSPIDPKTASVVVVDVSASEIERIDKTEFKKAIYFLGKEELEKLQITEENWPGEEHPFIKYEAQYPKQMPSKIDTKSLLISSLKTISSLSMQLTHVDSVMGTYLYDLFRAAKPYMDNMINSLSPYECTSIMEAAKDISRNFFEQSIHQMTIEDIAANTQLLLLTWRVALRFDKLSLNHIGLEKFSAPISGNHRIFTKQIIDPNGSPVQDSLLRKTLMQYVDANPIFMDPKKEYISLSYDTCAAYPGWLTTENDYEAWEMFQEANDALAADSKPRFMDPTLFYPDPIKCYNHIHIVYPNLDMENRKVLDQFSHQTRSRWLGHMAQFSNDALLGQCLAMTSYTTNRKSHPHFYDLMDVALMYYIGPWNRPSGHNDKELGPFALIVNGDTLFTTSVRENKSKRKSKYPDATVFRDIHTKRNLTPFEIIKYNQELSESGLSRDFLLRQFFDIRSSEALQDPQSIVRLYSYLSFIEGAKSCVFFANPSLVFIADRLFGMKKHFTETPKLVERVLNVLKVSLNSEMNYLTKNLEVISIFKRERIVNRMIQQSFVLFRFLVRASNWGSINANAVVSEVASLHDLWEPLASFNSIYGLSETYVAKVNLMLWSLTSHIKRKDLSDELIQHLVKLKAKYSDSNNADIVAALVSFRYFMAQTFLKQKNSNAQFDLVTKTSAAFRFPTVCSSLEIANIAAELIREQILNYFGTEEEKAEDVEWITNVSPNFDVIEFKTKKSESKIPFALIRISTGKCIVNGAPIIQKAIIFENPNFSLFFNEDDQKYAQNGQMTYLGETNGYTVENFRETERTYMFVSAGIDSVEMDVYYNFENNWWLWSRPDMDSTLSLVKALKLMNLDDMRIFYRLIGDSVEAFFIKDETKNPIYRVRVDKVKTPSESSISLSIQGFAESVTLLPSSQYKNLLPTALYGFSRPEFIAVYKNKDSRSVITFGPYRYGSDSLPVTFEERVDDKGNRIFVWLNYNTWCLDEEQGINDKGKIIPGTLKVRSLDGTSRAILVPNFEWKKKYKDLDYFKTSLIPVEMIKISNGDLLPKERTERFALAYKCMVGLQTDLAKQLLHPITSIDQNSPFNSNDFEVISWILDLQIDNPELVALKMITSALVAINLSLYPTHTSTWTMAKLTKMLEGTSYKYLMFVREISEKFYLHRLFPEIVYLEDLFSVLFSGKDSGYSTPKQTSIPMSRFCNNAKAKSIFTSLVSFASPLAEKREKLPDVASGKFDKNRINFSEDLTAQRFHDLVRMLTESDSIALNYFLLHFKSNEARLVEFVLPTRMDYEALLHCLATRLEFRTRIKSIFNAVSTSGFVGIDFATESLIIEANLEKCSSLEVLIQPNDYSNDFTKISITREVMLKDLKGRTFEDQVDSIGGGEFVSANELTTFTGLIEQIEKLSRTKSVDKKSSSIDFFSSKPYAKNSAVLQKLINSIKKFTETNLFDGSIMVNLKKDASGEILKGLTGLDNILVKRHTELAMELKELFSQLATMAQSDEKAPNFNLITELNILAHLKKQKTFSKLYGCYYTYSLKCFEQKFPHIQAATAKKLRDATFIFYSKQVLHDYYKTIKELTAKITSKAQVTLDELADLVVELKKIKTFDTRVKLPGILNFEYRSSQYRLREEQLNDLNLLQALQENKNNFKSKVIQRMMAAGKTLVLGTLATVLKARRKDTLSILVPPSSLFQSNSASMQARTYNYFKSRGNVLSFVRLSIPGGQVSAIKVLKFLKWFRYNLDETMKSRNYLVMTPDSLQSFINSYVEFLDNHKKLEQGDAKLAPAYESILKEFAGIYEIFNTKASIILDEIDMTMNPKHELNYPTVDRENYNMIAVTLTADLLEWSTFSQEVRKKVGLNLVRNNQAGLTDSGFTALHDLWLKYIEKELDRPESMWAAKLFDPPHVSINKENIMKFLRSSNPHEHLVWITKLLEINVNADQARALVILKIQLDRNLKEAFRSTVKEHYGPAGSHRKNIKFAVPYVAANTPSESSLFADRWETLNKSLMMTTIVSLTEAEVVEFLLWLKEQINIEAMTVGDPKNTVTYENFSHLIPKLNPLSVDIDDVEAISKIRRALRRKDRAAIRLLFSYHLDSVIAKLDFPTEQITANALHLTSMFASVQGYSGTIDNVNILPSEVVQESYDDHLINEKNNGAIIRKLILDSEDDSIVSVINGMDSVSSVVKNVKKLVMALKNDERISRFSALIDVGAFLKNFKNARVAEAFLKVLSHKTKIKCVLYYDELSNMLQFVHFKDKQQVSTEFATVAIEDEKLGASNKYSHGRLTLSDPDSIVRATGCAIDERFTFYDQRHITGSDILQPAGSIALLTFGSRNLLRDILQGTLRMRQFMSSQKVFFTVTPDVLQYFNSLVKETLMDLRVADIITMSALNEDEKQLRENIGLTYTKLDVKLRSEILRDLTAGILANDFSVVHSVFVPARRLFIRDFSEQPAAWIAEKTSEPAQEAISRFVEYRKAQIGEKYVESLKGLIAPCPQDGKSESVLCYAPSLLPKFDLNSAMNTEMQLELNSLQLNEFELESFVLETKINEEPIKFRRFRLGDCARVGQLSLKNVVSLAQVIEHPNQKVQAVQMLKDSLFYEASADESVTLHVSRDLINFVEFPVGVCPYAIFSRFNREATHIFVSKRPFDGRTDVILVSSDVAQEMLNDPITDCYGEWYLTDLVGNVILSRNPVDNNKSIFTIFEDLKKSYFDLLVFNGSLLQLTSQSDMKEIFFKEWIRKPEIVSMLSFLLARMRALQNKVDFVFDPEDALITTISRIINGDSDALVQLINETYEKTTEKQQMAPILTNAKANEIKRAQSVYDKTSLLADDDNDDMFDDSASVSSFNDSESDDSDSDDESISGRSSKSSKSIFSKGGLASFISVSEDRNINPDKHQIDFDNDNLSDNIIAPDADTVKYRHNIPVVLGVFLLLLLVGGTSYYFYQKQKKSKIGPAPEDKASEKVHYANYNDYYQDEQQFDSNENY